MGKSESEEIELRILSDPNEIENLYKGLIQSAKNEISFIVPTINAFMRQHKIEATDLIRVAAIERSVRVNLVIPDLESDKSSGQTFQEFHGLEQVLATAANVITRKHPSSEQTSIKSTILITDRESALIIDLSDDSRSDFTDAIGLATYSISTSRTQSYNFIFESIWTLAELYRQSELKTIEMEKLVTMAK